MSSIEEQIAGIFDKDKRAVSKIILEYQRDFDAVEDWMMDTFARALEKSELFDPSKSSLLTWVCNIAKGVCVNHIEEAKATKRPYTVLAANIENIEDCDAYYDQASLSPELAELCAELDPAVQHAAEDAVVYAHDQMSTQQREIFELKFEGNSITEIAEVLGTSEGVIRVQLTRIRNLIQELC